MDELARQFFGGRDTNTYIYIQLVSEPNIPFP